MAGFADKVQQARDAGYTDSEILSVFQVGGAADKVKQAREAGYSDTDIVNFLSSPAPAPEMTASRAAGLTARTALQAAPSIPLGLPALALDATESLLSLPSNLYNLGARALGSESRMPVPYEPFRNTRLVAQAGEKLADVAGTPTPETPGERRAVNIGTTGISALGGAGASSKIASRFAPTPVSPAATNSLGTLKAAALDPKTLFTELGANPIRQTLAATSGATAATVAQENGAPDYAVVGASLLGSLAPTAVEGAVRGGQSVVRRTLRGDEKGRQALNDNIALSQSLNLPLTVGTTATEGSGRNIQGFLANTPGGGGVVRNVMDAATEKLGTQAQDTARNLSGNTNAAGAGRAIKQGVENFVENFQAKQDNLYGEVNALLPQDAPVSLNNTIQTLERLTNSTTGASQTSKTLTNPKLVELLNNIKADINNNGMNGALPFTAVNGTGERMGIRQMIGQRLSNPSLIDDIPTSQLKQVYAALMQDMKESLRTSGNQKALSALERADTYTKAGHQRIDDVLQPIVEKKVPEQIFNAMLDQKGDGATKINTILKTLDDDQAKVVVGNIIRRMGTANPGQQGAEGGAFSARTFLTELNKYDPSARRALFAKAGIADDMEKIAKASEVIVGANAANANPSGTARNTAAVAVLSAIGGGFAAGGVQGGLLGAAAGGTGIATSYGLGKLMTNPTFVKWLGKQTELPASALPGQLQALQSAFRNAPPDEQKTVFDLINTLQPQQ